MKTYFRTYFLTYFEYSPETYFWATFRLLYFFGDFWPCGSRGPSQDYQYSTEGQKFHPIFSRGKTWAIAFRRRFFFPKKNSAILFWIQGVFLGKYREFSSELAPWKCSLKIFFSLWPKFFFKSNKFSTVLAILSGNSLAFFGTGKMGSAEEGVKQFFTRF